MPGATTTVTSEIRLSVIQEARLLVAVAVSDGTPRSGESLTVTLNGTPLEARVIRDAAGNRTHEVTAPPGELVLSYEAEVIAGGPANAPVPVTDEDGVEYLRPSRYCESDRFGPLAATLFPGLAGQDLVDAVVGWVRQHLRYIPGTSGAEDSAIDTLLAGQGVCRDFAHLTVALLRGSGIPARLAAVYAPGLVPMDFHAVAEVALNGHWQVVDSTRKAPRSSLVRIATGRDAADTAFLTVLSGLVNFGPVQVTAFAHGGLPIEGPTDVVHLPGGVAPADGATAADGAAALSAAAHIPAL